MLNCAVLLLGIGRVLISLSKAMTHGQCDARPTVTFPAARHHRPLAGTYGYQILLGDRGTCVLTTCPGLHWIAERPGFEFATY